MHVAPRGASARAVGVWLTCLALVVTSFAVAPGARAAETCRTTPNEPAAPTHSVTVCVSLPDGPLSGVVDVSAQVYVTPLTTATPPTVRRVVFWFGDGYLLTDFDPAYGFVWRTTRLPDGPGTFEVRVRTGDGLVSRVEVPVTLANGPDAARPPTVEPFRTRTGTVPEPGRRFRLVAVGDGVDGSAREEQVAAQIAGSSPNLLAYLGDVYQRGSPAEFDTWYAGPSGYARFRDITNPVVGNHEYQTPGAAGYFGFWGGVPHHYSYDVAGWHVVALDSTSRFDQVLPGTAQYEWLAADLGANRARCTLVYMHHPRYSVAGHAGRPRLGALWSLLAARRVTLALGGHSHAYQRWAALDGNGAVDARGVTQLVAGAGGREVKPVFAADARVATALSVQGALRLDLGPDDVEFSYVDSSGAVLDAGTVGCKSTGDPLPPTVPRKLRATPAPYVVRAAVLAPVDRPVHRGRGLHRAPQRHGCRHRGRRHDELHRHGTHGRQDLLVDRVGVRHLGQPVRGVAPGRDDDAGGGRRAGVEPSHAAVAGRCEGAQPRVRAAEVPDLARRRRRRVHDARRGAARRVAEGPAGGLGVPGHQRPLALAAGRRPAGRPVTAAHREPGPAP